MGYSTDFKEKVLEIMIRDKMSVRKAGRYILACVHVQFSNGKSLLWLNLYPDVSVRSP